MSIPVFFDPYEMDLDLPAWRAFINRDFGKMYSDAFVESALKIDRLFFLDGGLLSNFPIDAFTPVVQSATDAAIPTIGVALVGSNPNAYPRPVARGAKALVEHGVTAFNAIRFMRDREAIETMKSVARSNPSAKAHVAFIDTGTHNWLNFNLPTEAIEDLYVRGLTTCANFLAQHT